jgi:hypothetical protein
MINYFPPFKSIFVFSLNRIYYANMRTTNLKNNVFIYLQNYACVHFFVDISPTAVFECKQTWRQYNPSGETILNKSCASACAIFCVAGVKIIMWRVGILFCVCVCVCNISFYMILINACFVFIIS